MSTLSKETIENGSSSAVSQASSSAPPAPGQLHSDAVSLEVPLKVHGSKVTEVVRGVPPHTEPFEEQTSSMIVFPHGGVLRMSTSVSAGQMLVLTNLKSRQDAICRVVKVRTYSNSASYVEVEFTHRQPGFWGVYFEADAAEAASKSSSPAAGALSKDSAKSVSDDSSFIHFGSQEEVQPAASSTSAAKAARPAAPPPPAKPVVAAEVASLKVLAPVPANVAASLSAETTSLQHEEGASIADSEAEAPSESSSARVQTAGEAFGSRLNPAGDEQSSEGNQLGLLIAAGAAALLLLIGGGVLLFHHKSLEPSVAASAAHPREAKPLGAPSSNATVTPFLSKPAPAPTVRETPTSAAKASSTMAVVRESPAVSNPPAPSDPAPVPATAPSAPAARTSVPSVFGTLNAHPISTNHSVAAAAPNVEATAPAAVENPLLGIASAGASSSELPPPTFNGNIPLPTGGRVKEPQLLTRVLPQYPMLARQSHTQGDVTLQIVVDKSGNVADGKVISGPPTLRQAALDAVRRWKYEAPTLDGQSIMVQMLVTVRFQL
jgi:TonB family protein